MVNKASSFAAFVRFRPYTYARTQQSLPPLWAAIIVIRMFPVITKHAEENDMS